MSGGWEAKRFWTDVTVGTVEGGWDVRLDGKPIRTPAKAALILPTEAMAEAVAAEWRRVEGKVDPRVMPVTRSANAAIDKVAPQFDEVAELISDYGDSDLLCYRATDPDLAAVQAAAWDPWLAWSAAALDAPLRVVEGIVAYAQPPESLARLDARVRGTTPFELTALSDLVALTGSLVLGFAAADRPADREAIWDVSRFDEKWQERKWGADDEAQKGVAAKHRDFLHAGHFWDLSRPRA
jgi:chaperone required for assembly of F1-ATPase